MYSEAEETEEIYNSDSSLLYTFEMSDVKTAAEQRAVVAAATTASQQSDNIAHALAGAGGGILSMILT